MNLNKWAETINSHFYTIWKSKYQKWSYGFKIFYSNLVENPRLLILSYQPGGNESHYLSEDSHRFERGDFSINGNIYIDSNGRMANEVKKLTGYFENNNILVESVVLPFIFWRSPNVYIWKNNPNMKEMNQDSLKLFKKIFTKIRPQKILIIGFETYSELRKVFDFSEFKTIYKRESNMLRLAGIARFGGIPVMVTPHLTGSRIGVKDKIKLKEIFNNFIN